MKGFDEMGFKTHVKALSQFKEDYGFSTEAGEDESEDEEMEDCSDECSEGSGSSEDSD